MQTAAVSHIAQLNAWASGTKPWSFKGYEEAVRAAMLFRTRLTPYLYTAFAEYRFAGKPVIRPMALIDGGEETDQFMLGSSLLVAPMLTDQKTRTVRLPAGNWYDFDTGLPVGNGVKIEISPELTKIPVYVREGSLIPTLDDAATNSTLKPGSKLVVRQYGAGVCRGLLYDDDGETFEYEKGDFGWFALSTGGGVVTAHRTEGRRPLSYAAIRLLKIGADHS